MKNKIKRFLKVIILFILILSTLTGCWSRRELNSLAIVLGVGIDVSDNPNQIDVTAQIVKTSAIKSGKDKSGGGEAAYWNAKLTGDRDFEIFRNFTHEVARKLYVAHNEVLIFGRKLAEKGIRDQLDLFCRDHEMRLNQWVLVARDRASDVLDTKPTLEKIPAEKINSMLQIQFANSETIPVQLIDLMTMLTSPTTSAVLPIIEVDGEGDNKVISLSGTAVFKQDKMIGELNRGETRGLLWINGKAQSGILTVEIPEGKADIEIGESQSTLKSEFKDGKLTVGADIVVPCTIGSQTGIKNLADVKTVQKLEDATQKAIRDEIARCLQKAKDLHADIYGFGELLHKKDPGEWKSIEKDWDSYFQDMELDVSVKVTLRASGRITQPVAPPEKEE